MTISVHVDDMSGIGVLCGVMGPCKFTISVLLSQKSHKSAFYAQYHNHVSKLFKHT